MNTILKLNYNNRLLDQTFEVIYKESKVNFLEVKKKYNEEKNLLKNKFYFSIRFFDKNFKIKYSDKFVSPALHINKLSGFLVDESDGFVEILKELNSKNSADFKVLNSFLYFEIYNYLYPILETAKNKNQVKKQIKIEFLLQIFVNTLLDYNLYIYTDKHFSRKETFRNLTQLFIRALFNKEALNEIERSGK